jgi:hypothetical protein
MANSSLLALNLSDIIAVVQTRCLGAFKGRASNLPKLDPQAIKKTIVLLPSMMFKPKIGGLLISLFIVVMPVGKDWAFTTLWGKQMALDSQITMQQGLNTQKEAELKQFAIWKEQLKGLRSDILVLKEGQSAKVLASSEIARLLSFAKGDNRDPELGPPLPSPHTHRQFISMSPGVNRIVNLLANDPQASVAPSPTPAPTAPAPMGGPPMGNPMGMASPQQSLTKLNAWRFDYDITLQGTYAGLADVLNEWIHYKHLVVFRNISLKPVDGQLVYADAPKPTAHKSDKPTGDKGASLAIPTFSFMEPTPAQKAATLAAKQASNSTDKASANSPLPVTDEGEDAPVVARPTGPAAPLQMTVSFSIYLFDPAIQAQEADPVPTGG